MPSSKKQRGKQRKAAALAAASARGAVLKSAPMPSSKGSYSVRSSDPYAVLEGIRRGERLATDFVAHDTSGGSDIEFAFREHLVDDGLIQVVLAFLNQCENDITGFERCLPTLWLRLLATILVGNIPTTQQCVDGWRLQIANNIGPIVTCMSDSSRKFFNSRSIWHSAVAPFIGLVNNIAKSEEASSVLLKYKGLLGFIVQSLFWEYHRPDILTESMGSIDFQETTDFALSFIVHIIDSDNIDKRATRRLLSIGKAQIVDKAYSGRYVPFVCGLIAHLQSKHQRPSKQSAWCSEGIIIQMIKKLINAGCVDKDVITGVLDYAKFTKRALNYDDAVNATCFIFDMLTLRVGVEEKPSPIDNRFAFAIDQGLLQTCLELLVRFKNASNDELLENLRKLLDIACGASMLMKSSKAVINQRSGVMKSLRDSEVSLEHCSQKCKEIFQMIKMVVLLKVDIEDYSFENCHHCGKLLRKAETKKCGNCMLTIYCFQNCQAEDWMKGGHKHHCNKMAADTDRIMRENRDNALRQHLDAAANKLMDENYRNILAQATIQNYDILDCVVVIDLTSFPTIVVKLSADFLSEQDSSDKHAFYRNLFDEHRHNGFLTSVCQSLSCHNIGLGHGLSGSDWPLSQARFKDDGFLYGIQHHQKAREMLGPFFCSWYQNRTETQE